ncbi:SAM-dependent methyltransferase [Citreicella sp. C3M06]|uniref:class I SAM-dependent methyltransferase n=1 Tax=Citreicella sp. C3M06 TaxID=2841564 RepID=UPI001C0A4539|nr:SAM-dependent methyltransferase [Citreicella sp. C3M06]MBU2959843.1 SAM-dependent methyltransferase [Citreicella sp. C3M06]
MTALAEILHRRIAAEGPMSIAEYMTLCLLHPVHGYYTTRDPLGADGDFTTAPEISQMFGELIGLSLAQSWIDQGRPDFVLAELGPGRGTLMNDATRAMGAVPGMLEAAQIYLVEASPTLRARQAEVLGGMSPIWVDSLADLPEAPLWLVANEFFDALPIRQFLRAGEGWAERVVGQSDGHLAFGLTEPAPVAALAHLVPSTPEGTLIETCSPAQGVAAELGRRIAQHGGAALIIDYGDNGSAGNTFQAVRAHEKVSALAQPGQADLTAHVDFCALAQAAPCAHTALVPQGVFLETLGITQRARRLAQGLAGPALEAHIAAHRRLTHPSEMGSLFKVLGFVPEGAPVPPGLLAADLRER